MTRSEIREAIKKVFFEEIEPDSLTKKMSFRSKTGSKKYKSLDGKQNFRSRHEALAYNVFGNEGVLDQIESEAYRFKKTCNKIPDFVWENKKIIIEIAGMNEALRPGYWKKLLEAKPCFEKQGYTVYIIDTRQRSIYYNYINFYKYLCNLLGFTPKPEIKNDIFSYVGDPIDLIKQNQELIQYKKDNPNATHQEISDRFNTSSSIVFRTLKQAGLTTPKSQTQSQSQAKHQEIIQYKKDNPNSTRLEIADELNTTLPIVSKALEQAGLTTPKSQTQPRNQEIIQYKKDNPNTTYQEISDRFNISPSIVFKVLKQAGLTTPNPQTLSQIQARNPEIIQYKKDNPEATRKQIADKFNITLPAIDNIIQKAGLTTSLSQTQALNQARNQEIIQYKKDNPNATRFEIADKFNVSASTIYLLFKPKQSDPTNEQSINHKTMTLRELREIIRKAMHESTIDVPGDPNKLTPQQKSTELAKARRMTRKPKLGTSEDPVDFI